MEQIITANEDGDLELCNLKPNERLDGVRLVYEVVIDVVYYIVVNVHFSVFNKDVDLVSAGILVL